MEARCRSRTYKPVHAAVDRVALPLPGCAKPPWLFLVHLEDPGLEPVHLSVAARREPCDPAAYNDNRFFRHISPHRTRPGVSGLGTPGLDYELMRDKAARRFRS